MFPPCCGIRTAHFTLASLMQIGNMVCDMADGMTVHQQRERDSSWRDKTCRCIIITCTARIFLHAGCCCGHTTMPCQAPTYQHVLYSICSILQKYCLLRGHYGTDLPIFGWDETNRHKIVNYLIYVTCNI